MRFIALCLLVTGLVACGPGPTREQRYAHWLAGHGGEVAVYRDYLRRYGLDEVLPMPQLLRSARRWRRCGVEEFVVPPQSEWPAMRATLELVRDLGRTGFLEQAEVASAYRDESLNRCEGGSRLSRHRSNNALDFDLAPGDRSVARLCAYWRSQGAARKFGLGFYTGGRIHVDTSGFRTWGSDFTRRSSPCAS
ncbi:MAG TPA: D-Ala-D-Ala carboxypeptidase family metallohydrolase [Lysobacter sp.]